MDSIASVGKEERQKGWGTQAMMTCTCMSSSVMVRSSVTAPFRRILDDSDGLLYSQEFLDDLRSCQR